MNADDLRTLNTHTFAVQLQHVQKFMWDIRLAGEHCTQLQMLCHSSDLSSRVRWLISLCCVLTVGFSLQSPWLFGSVCRQSDTVGIPDIQPVWTCGIEVTGNFNCPAGEKVPQACMPEVLSTYAHNKMLACHSTGSMHTWRICIAPWQRWPQTTGDCAILNRPLGSVKELHVWCGCRWDICGGEGKLVGRAASAEHPGAAEKQP